jgi:pectate lyase
LHHLQVVWPVNASAGNNVSLCSTNDGVTWTGNVTNSDGTQRVMLPGTDSVYVPPYSYTLESATSAKSSVMANAGAGAGPFAQ